MAWNDYFNGFSQDKSKLSSHRYTLLVCQASDFTRGALFEDGATLYILGSADTYNFKGAPDKSGLNHPSSVTVSRMAEFSAEVYADADQKALSELEDYKLTVFVVDSSKLLELDGFVYSAADFSSINGICNAEYIFDDVFLSIDAESNHSDIEKFTVSASIKNQSDMSSKVYEDEPVGTFTELWDFTTTSSLTGSVNSTVLSTIQGTESYDTDHYDIDGSLNEGLRISSFTANGVVDPDKQIFAVFTDFVTASALASGKVVFLFTDGSSSADFILESAGSGTIRIDSSSYSGQGGDQATVTYATTTRNQVLVYMNQEKNVVKILGSSGEVKRYNYVDFVPLSDTGTAFASGGFLGLFHNNTTGTGIDVDLYKFGVSS